MKPMPNSIQIGTVVRNRLGSEGQVQDIILSPSPTGGVILFTVLVTKTTQGDREPVSLTSPALEWSPVDAEGKAEGPHPMESKSGEVCPDCNKVHDREIITPEMAAMAIDFRRTQDEDDRTAILAELADRFADNIDDTMVDVPQWVHKAVLQWREALEKSHNKTMRLGRIVLAQIEANEGRKTVTQHLRQLFSPNKPPKDDKPMN